VGCVYPTSDQGVAPRRVARLSKCWLSRVREPAGLHRRATRGARSVRQRTVKMAGGRYSPGRCAFHCQSSNRVTRERRIPPGTLSRPNPPRGAHTTSGIGASASCPSTTRVSRPRARSNDSVPSIHETLTLSGRAMSVRRLTPGSIHSGRE
jgi:hypothetical protein